MRTAKETLKHDNKVYRKTSSRSSFYDTSKNTVNENIERVKDSRGQTFGQARLSSAAKSSDNEIG